MSRTALITGITGQDGSYLADLLISKDYQVHGIVRRTSNVLFSRIQHLVGEPNILNRRLFLHTSDLNDTTTLRRIFQKVQPEEFYHLAGQSDVGLSFEIPESTCEETALSTLRLLEICRDQPRTVKFYHASSSEIFGLAETSPQTEDTPIRPASPYGCAKAFATNMARVYRNAYGMFVCNGILYNHESPRRGERFVTRKISRQVARIKLNLAKELSLGNIHAERDWGHACDYVEAIWRIMQHSEADDYVVATGVSHSVLDFATAAFAVVGLEAEKYLRQDKLLLRPTDPAHLVGCADKIRKTLGWKPTHSFEQIVREMVEADLAELQRKG